MGLPMFSQNSISKQWKLHRSSPINSKFFYNRQDFMFGLMPKDTQNDRLWACRQSEEDDHEAVGC